MSAVPTRDAKWTIMSQSALACAATLAILSVPARSRSLVSLRKCVPSFENYFGIPVYLSVNRVVDFPSCSSSESLHAIAVRTSQHLSRDERPRCVLLQPGVPRNATFLSPGVLSQLGMSCTLGLHSSEVWRPLSWAVRSERPLPGYQSQSYL